MDETSTNSSSRFAVITNYIHRGVLHQESVPNIIDNDNTVKNNVILEHVKIPNNISLKEQVQQYAVQFVSKLYANPGQPRSLVQEYINDTSEYSFSTLSTIYKIVKSNLETNYVNSGVIAEVSNSISILKEPFADLTSEYFRLKYRKRQGYYIEPEVYPIFSDMMIKKVDKRMKLELDKHVNGVFIPLRKVLKAFLELPNDFTILIDADNLAMHTLLGFVESFSSNYPCRFYRIHKRVMHFQCEEDPGLFRDKVQHELDCFEANVKNSGVNGCSVLKSIDHSEPTANPSADIMNDIFEGVCIYDMQHVLYDLIFIKKYFTTETLNFRIIAFNYGSSISNKPVQFKEHSLKEKRIKMTPNGMRTFVRTCAHLVGDLVLETVVQ